MAKNTKDAKEAAKKSKGAIKNFIEEFKAFALKGNVIDMAVGVIIGAAFQNIVASLTENFINPLIKVFTGGAGDDGVEIGGVFRINGVSFNYGAFITAVVNFLIMALILFIMIKAVNKVMSLGKKEEVKEVTTKICPFCKSEIAIDATRCPHCTSELETAKTETVNAKK